MSNPRVHSLNANFEQIVFRGDRTPESTDIGEAFCRLSEYRDGAIFLAHYAGYSEWERHSSGDEIVMVMAGSTTIVLLEDDKETAYSLKAGELIVVPRGAWHRFESPQPVKVLTVTPAPTDHSVTRPSQAAGRPIRQTENCP